MPRPSLAAAFLAAVAVVIPLAAPAALATGEDSVDLQIPGNATIKGTIRGADERESFLLVLPRGATIKAVATRRGRGALRPDLDLVVGDPPSPALVPGTVVTHQSKGSTLTSPVLDSGEYRVRVFGNGLTDGDYLLKITVKLKGSWTGYGSAAALEAGLMSEFGAPAGARAQVKLTPRTASSDFVAALDDLVGPDAFDTAITGSKTPWIRLGPTGTYSVLFHENGAIGGTWKCAVALRLPTVRKRNVDISARRLGGNFVDNQQVYGASVGGGGGTVDPPDIGGPLDGASVTIPGGALPFPVVITMSEGAAFTLPGGGHPTGPVVQFGPPGTSFNGLSATVTLPYDPADFIGGDPATDLTVYVRNTSTGDVEAVLPREDYDFVTVPGAVRFPAPHFSSYVSSATGPRPVDGRWVVVSVAAKPEADYGGSTSIVVGQIDFLQGQSAYSEIEEGLESQWFRLFDDGKGGGPQPTINVSSAFGTDNGTYQVPSDDQIVLTPGSTQDPPVTLRRGKSPDVMFLLPDANDGAELAVLLRAVSGEPAPGNIAGRWHAFFYALGGRSEGGAPSPLLELYASAGRATMIFSQDGRIAIEGRQGRDARTDFPQGGWTSRQAEVPGSATYRLGDGILFFETKDPDTGLVDTSIRLRPCLDGDVLVGAAGSPGDTDSLLLFLVRELTGQKPSALAGTTSVINFSAEVVDRTLKDTASGFDLSTTLSDMEQGPPLKLTVRPEFRNDFGHDAAGAPAVKTTVPRDATRTTMTFNPNGAFRTANGVFGAVSRGRDLFFAVQTDGTSFELNIGPPGVDLTAGTITPKR